MCRGWSRRAGIRGAGLVLAAALLAACATPLTVSQEKQLGAQVAMDMRRQIPLLADPVVDGYIEDMGREILTAAGPQPYTYRFFVVEDEEINAFAAPAGYVYVHTGTILKARNASELAGVLAHEIGHVVRRHIAENYGRSRSTSVLYRTAVLAASLFGGGAGAAAAQLGGGIAATAYLNSFGREAEMEADAFAVEVLPRAGYDPMGLLTFFRTIQAEGGAGVPTFLSSHPATEDRIAATRALIAAVPARADLRVNDGGRFEIIQHRVRLLTRRAGAGPARTP